MTIILTPTSAGMTVSVEGRTTYQRLTGDQLLSISRRFADAAAERLRDGGDGSWIGLGVQLDGDEVARLRAEVDHLRDDLASTHERYAAIVCRADAARDAALAKLADLEARLA